MKKFNLFIVTLLLSFFTCFSFAEILPVYNGKICNIITNLDKYLNDYYVGIECGDELCDGNGIFRDNINKCLPGWGGVYLVPNDIESESHELMKRGRNERHLFDKRDIRIGMLRDLSTNGDLTRIYEITYDSNWIQYNGAGIKLELVDEYEGYDILSETFQNNYVRNDTFPWNDLPSDLSSDPGYLMSQSQLVKILNRISVFSLYVLILGLILITFITRYMHRGEEKILKRIGKRCLIYMLIIIVIRATFILLYKYKPELMIKGYGCYNCVEG